MDLALAFNSQLTRTIQASTLELLEQTDMLRTFCCQQKVVINLSCLLRLRGEVAHLPQLASSLWS